MKKGFFIAFEGIDGAGKSTQIKLLARVLRARGRKVAIVDFPRYSKPSSYFIKKYLKGELGSWQLTDPHLISIFYALDRLDAKEELAKSIAGNDVVLANRYTASNMAHQGAKIIKSISSRAKSRDYLDRRVLQDFLRWLYNFEFKLLEIPKPDLNLLLYLDPKVAVKLIKTRGRKTDIHEESFRHLSQAAAAYLEAAKLYPKEFRVINCAPHGKLRTVENIHKEVLELVIDYVRS